jgi:hypothetical protein
MSKAPPPLQPGRSLAIASRPSSLHPQIPRSFQRLGRSSAASTSLDDAVKVPAYKGDRTFRDRVSSKAPDFYQLKLIEESDISSVFHNRADSAIVATPLDAKGNPAVLVNGKVDKFKIRPHQSRPVDLFGIPAGTYYLQVSTRAEDARYRLKIEIERSCGCS